MVYWMISFLIGAVAVLQGGLNRKITLEWGLSSAVFLNSFILLIIALLFLWFCYAFPQLMPESFAPKVDKSTFKSWFLIPSVCGFLIIFFIPALIPKVGASSVFLFMVIGQLVFSLLWDIKVESLNIEPRRFLGLGIVIIGLLISYWKK